MCVRVYVPVHVYMRVRARLHFLVIIIGAYWQQVIVLYMLLVFIREYVH